MRKNLNNLIPFICSLIFGIIMIACSDDGNDYLKYVEDGEILYIGKLESLKLNSGYYRVEITGKIPSDPKATEARIYWNNYRDSIVQPIVRTGGNDMFSVIIDGLEENFYSFSVQTFDDQGNKSVISTVSGAVYGDIYLSDVIANRPISDIPASDEGYLIEFVNLGSTTGAVGTEVVYTSTDGSEKTEFVGIFEESLLITDLEWGTTIKYRTLYIPSEGAIDNFYTEYDIIQTPNKLTLGNASQPYSATLGISGQFGTLNAPWITNAAAKNQDNGTVGGYQENCCNDPEKEKIFSMVNGTMRFTNAKIYQNTMVEAGKFYRLTVDVVDNSLVASNYIVVALGDGIPDIDNLDTAPEVITYNQVTGPGKQVLEFTASETGQISLGIVVTQSNTQARFVRIKSWD